MFLGLLQYIYMFMNYKLIFRFFRPALFPFSILYGFVMSIRNLFFDWGFFSSRSFSVPVIAVGNLSVGGTGKTPQIAYLIHLLQKDFKVAVLSRGYKRKSKGFVLASSEISVEEFGDEPYFFYKKFPHIIVAVDENRSHGIQKLLDCHPEIDVVLLDDAFQHRKVHASFYTLLTSYDALYTKDFVLPAGNLREPRRGAKRANTILVTKCPLEISTEERQRIVQKIAPTALQQVFFTKISYAPFVVSESDQLPVASLRNYAVVLLTGIANPKPLLAYLTAQQVAFTHLSYPDHHSFDAADLQTIQKTFAAVEGEKKLLLTTEKDAVRLQGKIEGIYALGIQTDFIEGRKDFDTAIRNNIDSFY